jgi:hypothetical protein
MIQIELSLFLTRLHKEFEMTPLCVATLKRYLYEIWRHLCRDRFRFRREVWRANPALNVGFSGVQNKLTGLAIIFGWFPVFQKPFKTIFGNLFQIIGRATQRHLIWAPTIDVMPLYPIFEAPQAIRSCGADMMIYDFASNPVVGLLQGIVKSRMGLENVHSSLPPRKILNIRSPSAIPSLARYDAAF